MSGSPKRENWGSSRGARPIPHVSNSAMGADEEEKESPVGVVVAVSSELPKNSEGRLSKFRFEGRELVVYSESMSMGGNICVESNNSSSPEASSKGPAITIQIGKPNRQIRSRIMVQQDSQKKPFSNHRSILRNENLC